MPQPRRQHCTCCGRHKSEAGPISWGGNCRRCGKALMNENCEGIAAKQGYAHLRRLRGYARYVERAMLEATGTQP